MSARESDTEKEPFVEDDGEQTWIAYDRGGLPTYVLLVWIALVVGYGTYMVLLSWPDLMSWGAP